MSSLFTANRLAAIATWLVALGAEIAGVAHTFPTKWQAPSLVIAGLLTHATVVYKFLDGSQKSEAVTASKEIETSKIANNAYLAQLEQKIDELTEANTDQAPAKQPVFDQETDTVTTPAEPVLPDPDTILNDIENTGLAAPPASATKPTLS